MAIQDKIDSAFTDKLLKKTLMSAGKVQKADATNDNTHELTKSNLVTISNSFTSLQNAFNKIYANTLNVRNLHQYEEKRLSHIKKETGLENKIASGSTPTVSNAGGSGSSLASTAATLDQLASSIENLNDKMKKINLSGNGYSNAMLLGDAVGDVASSSRSRAARMGGRALGVAGVGLDVYGRHQEGQSAGQIATGVGGGLAGAALGAKGGAAAGAAIGAFFGGVGAVPGAAIGGFIGGIGGYFAGSYAGDTAYDALNARAMGGGVKAGGSYIVGERGPEVLMLGGLSGRVIANGQKGRTPQSEKYLMAAADKSSRAATKVINGQPPGPTSYSSKFSNYLSSLFGNMPNWLNRIKDWLGIGPDGGDGGDMGDYFGGEFSELTAAEVANSSPGANRSGASDWRTDTAFLNEVNNVGREHGFDPRALLGLIASESGFDPGATAENGAYGLFQFMPKWNRANMARIRGMNRAEQVRFVNETYFRRYDVPENASAGALYASIFAPSIAKRIRYDRFTPLYSRGQDGYTNNADFSPTNPGLDINRDGVITIADLDARIVGKAREYRLPGLRSATGYVSRLGGEGVVTSRRGMRDGRMHHGTDIAADAGTRVASLNDGQVGFAGTLQGFGNVIYVNQDDGLQVRYGHLRGFAPGIRNGVRVSATQIIGYVGNTGRSRGTTGNHLHFEIRRGRDSIESYDTYMNNRWIVGGVAAPRPEAAAPTPTPLTAEERNNAAVRMILGEGQSGVTGINDNVFLRDLINPAASVNSGVTSGGDQVARYLLQPQ